MTGWKRAALFVGLVLGLLSAPAVTHALTLQPIGTFNEGNKVTLWAGVSPKSFRILTVTREQADGNQASSGDKVLVGKVQPRG